MEWENHMNLTKTTIHLFILCLSTSLCLAQGTPPPSPPGYTKGEKQWKEELKKSQKEQKEESKQDKKARKEEDKRKKESAPYPIETIYDKFKDTTTVGTAFRIVEYNLNQTLGLEVSFYSLYEFKGTQNNSSGQPRITIRYTLFNSLSPLANNNLIFLVDGTPIDLGEMEILKTERVSNYITVDIGKYVSLEVLEKIANANIVEGRLGSGVEFQFKDKHIFTLRKFTEQIRVK